MSEQKQSVVIQNMDRTLKGQIMSAVMMLVLRAIKKNAKRIEFHRVTIEPQDNHLLAEFTTRT